MSLRAKFLEVTGWRVVDWVWEMVSEKKSESESAFVSLTRNHSVLTYKLTDVLQEDRRCPQSR